MDVPLPVRPGLVGPVISLLERETIRFLRQRSRVFGALGQPVLFWLLLGSGFGASFSPPGAPQGTTYLTWFFPGIIVLVLLFTAIFSTISIIEDRSTGFLQAVLVAPIPRLSIVLGKLLGGTILATGQGMLLLVAAPLMGLPLSLRSILLTLGALAGTAFALTGIGFCIAWRMESTQGFHMIMNVFLMPMWLLSGAFFPLEGAPSWLRFIMEVNPLTYGVAAVRRALSAGATSLPLSVPPLWVSLAVTGLFSLIVLLTSVALVYSSRRLPQ
ncbi:MAG: ABC transporter permease [Acidobacteriota bacterium]